MCHTAGGTDDIPNDIHSPELGTARDHPDGFRDPARRTLGSGCTDCHTMPTIAPASSHINGTAVADGAANTDRGLWTTTTGGGDRIVCEHGRSERCRAGGCHDGPGEVGNWERIWSTTAANSDGTECANCHGVRRVTSWAYDGTQAGSVEHDKDWDTAQSSPTVRR